MLCKLYSLMRLLEGIFFFSMLYTFSGEATPMTSQLWCTQNTILDLDDASSLSSKQWLLAMIMITKSFGPFRCNVLIAYTFIKYGPRSVRQCHCPAKEKLLIFNMHSLCCSNRCIVVLAIERIMAATIYRNITDYLTRILMINNEPYASSRFCIKF